MKISNPVTKPVFLLVFICLSCFSYAQVWKKIIPGKSDEHETSPISTEAGNAIVRQIREDIKALTSGQMGGRNIGSRGEELAGMYIGTRLNKEGIGSYGTNFKHPFRFVSGKDFTPETRFTIDRKFIFIPEDAFPAPFSAAGEDNNYVLPESRERSAPWLIPLYTSAQEAHAPDFDWLKNTYSRALNAIERGATSVIFYDSYGSKYAPAYVRQSAYPALSVPVIIVSKKAYDAHIKDMRVMEPLYINIKFRNEYQKGTNIIGYIDNHAATSVIIGAHYDGLGYGDDLKKDVHVREVFNGADDNASGVAAMLSLAGLIKSSGFNKYNYIFLAFSGNEQGLLGAKAFVEDKAFDKKQIAFVINLDMVGRFDNVNKKLYINAAYSADTWTRLLNTSSGRFHLIKDDSSLPQSDYLPFYEQKIPCLSFSTGIHSDYQKATDDLQKINFAGEKDIIVYVYNLLSGMEKADPPQFRDASKPVVASEPVTASKPVAAPNPTIIKPVSKSNSENKGPVVYNRIGLTADSTYDGFGVKIASVAAGQPAAMAGLQADDIILQLDKTKINDLGNFNSVITKLPDSKNVLVKVKRGPTIQAFNLIVTGR